MPQTNILGDGEGKMSPSCPVTELSPRNSDCWDLCPPGPHTPLHVPIWVGAGLRSKMDLLLPWPRRLESEASLWNEAWLKLQGGRTRWRETQFLSGMATRSLRAARNHPLSLGLSFPAYKLFPLNSAPLPSFPSQEQADLFSSS